MKVLKRILLVWIVVGVAVHILDAIFHWGIFP